MPRGIRGFSRVLDHSQTVIGSLTAATAAGAEIRLDAAAATRLAGSSDPVLALAGTIGAMIKLEGGGRWLVAGIRSIADDMASIDFIGEGTIGADGSLEDFRRGVSAYPRTGAAVVAVGSADIAKVFATEDKPCIEVGTVYPTSSVRAGVYYDTFLSKNFAIVGSTGTGKSTATALILHRIIDHVPHGHVVVIDPHGEYDRAFAGKGEIVTVDDIAMPYWLMSYEEHCEVLLSSQGADRVVDRDILSRCLNTARGRSIHAQGLGSVTADTPIPYAISDLMEAIDAQAGQIAQSSFASNYMRIRNKLAAVARDPRYAFMWGPRMAADTMQPFLARILRMDGSGKPITIVDLSGVPSDVIGTAVSVMARVVFDFAIWAKGENKPPVLLVCEEAHRYVPSRSIRAEAPVRDILERIAKEGRKYGVSLGLVTQRPSDLAEGALSQCGTIVSLRLNNERDIAFVRAAMPEGGKALLDAVPALRNRECVISGEGVAVPMRVRLDDLADALRPASSDPVYSELWSRTGDEDGILTRTIQRWRSQAR